MAALLLPNRFTRQPQYRVRLDRAHPLTRGIDIAFIDLEAPGLIGPATLTKVESPTRVGAQYGLGWYFGAFGGDSFDAQNWPVLAAGTEYTYLVVAQLTATGSIGHLVDGDNSTLAFQFRVETTGAPSLLGWNTVPEVVTATGTVIPIGEAQTIIARQTTTTCDVFQKGVKTATTAFTGTIAGQVANEYFVGTRSGSTNLKGSIGLLIRWNRAISDAEALEISRNPWQLFAASPRKMWFGFGASSSGTSATTNANDTSSASGTTTVTGTVARTNANDTATASGVAGEATGTVAYTNANDTSTTSGTTTVLGTSAATNAADTSTASGTQTVLGTLATTNANDALTASGAATIIGTSATTNAADTTSGSGTGTGPIVPAEGRSNAGGGGKSASKTAPYRPQDEEFWNIRENYLLDHLEPEEEDPLALKIPTEVHELEAERAQLYKLAETARAAEEFRAITLQIFKLTTRIDTLMDEYYLEAALVAAFNNS